MADIIQLLPDSIANQIAAGEVIQRPSSAVKELLENAIDSGATQIRVILKEAGKTLIQIIDDGCGMSDTDARMAFERHATSKIRSTKDLFEIKTMGFRGEALASIAAIAQVELKTRLHKNDLGTKIIISGSKVKSQEACQTAAGTSFSIKNLFYNVPARRNFLKSNNVELRHIIDEFQRVALSNPEVFFSLHHNENELFHLPSGNLRQRIVAVFGSTYNKRLVPVSENTDVVKIEGFVGKPEFAKKSRGEQLFFVNNRFIKSGYLHHAVMAAYEGLISDKNFPFYAIFIEIDPSRIDINVHPTKQEIKFDDERLIYQYLGVAVRHALGQYAVTPSLNFDRETGLSSFQTAASARNSNPTPQQSNISKPSTGSTPSSFSGGSQKDSKSQSESNWGQVRRPQESTNPNAANNLKNWQMLFDGVEEAEEELAEAAQEQEAITISSSANNDAPELGEKGFDNSKKAPFQIQSTYIVSHIKSGFLLIDQQSAHERILYEQYIEQLKNKTASTQKELFPNTLQVPPGDAELLKSILPEINALGFDIQEFGQNAFILHGVPSEMTGDINGEAMIEKLLEQFKSNMDLKLGSTENIARSMARSAAIKRGRNLTVLEMQTLIDQLFACSMPYASPSGKKCFINYDMEDLKKQFEG